jgi:hypothetical protein
MILLDLVNEDARIQSNLAMSAQKLVQLSSG